VVVALEVEDLVEAEVEEDIHMDSPSELEWWIPPVRQLTIFNLVYLREAPSSPIDVR